MAETVQKSSVVRRKSKAGAENSATGEAKPARKAKSAAAKPVADATPKTVAKKAVKKPAAKKVAAVKASKAVAGKPVLVMRTVKATPVTEAQIAQLAYRYWQEGGCRHGHDHEDWARAERELRESVVKTQEKASAPAAKKSA